MLADRDIGLDAVIELRVDEDALVRRIESRIVEMKARGEPLREDDNPEVLHKRLSAYRDLTAPLIAYYRQQGCRAERPSLAARRRSRSGSARTKNTSRFPRVRV